MRVSFSTFKERAGSNVLRKDALQYSQLPRKGGPIAKRYFDNGSVFRHLPAGSVF